MNQENSHNHSPNSSSGQSKAEQLNAQRCAEIERLIPAYSIGATDQVETAMVEAHLAECPRAAATLKAHQVLAQRLLHSAPPAAPSPQLAERLRMALAKPTSNSTEAAQRVPQRSPLLRGRPQRSMPPSRQRSGPRPRRGLPFGARPRVATPTNAKPRRATAVAPALPPAMAMYQLQADQLQPNRPVTAPASRRQKPRAARFDNPWHFGRFLATAGVLALVFLNLALLDQNQQFQRQHASLISDLAQQNQAIILLAAEEAQEIEIFAPDGESKAQADILWNNQLRLAVVYVRDFPQCDPGMKYQLWLTKDGERTSGGLFSVDSNGMGLLVVPLQDALDLYDAIGITQEPDGGSSDPTAPPVVRGEL